MSSDNDSRHLLVVDDDPATLEACHRYLGDSMRVSGAGSDHEALALLHGDQRFDVALVSIDGGAVSGMGMFKKLMERSLRVPRLALTRGDDLSVIREAIADGASEFLVKPVNGPDLSETVERVLTRVERRRQNWSERAAYSAPPSIETRATSKR